MRGKHSARTARPPAVGPRSTFFVRRVGLPLAPKFFKQSVNIAPDVIGLGLCVGDKLVAGALSAVVEATAKEIVKRVARLGHQMLKLIGQTSSRVGASLGGKQHSQRKAEGSPREGTPKTDPRRAVSCVFLHEQGIHWMKKARAAYLLLYRKGNAQFPRPMQAHGGVEPRPALRSSPNPTGP